ncbi:MAG: hypothetical protein KC933_20470 [Myxococcales bacterium]|nr:hypothetical protein [Myxococcales bacterium]
MLRATPDVVEEGGESEVEFVVSGADKVELIRAEVGGQDQPIYLDDQSPQAGRVRLSRLVNDTYVRLEASAQDGARIDTEEVLIQVAAPGEVAITGFTANPTQVSAGGQVQLSWSTINATRVDLKAGDEVIETGLEAEGTVEVVVDVTTTFTLIADGLPSAVAKSVTVEVLVEPGPAVLEASFNPASATIQEGDNAVLRWRTANADQVQLQAGGNTFYTTSDPEAVLEGRMLLSPNPGTAPVEVVASAPNKVPDTKRAVLTVTARPPAPTFTRPPTVEPLIMPIDGADEGVEVTVHWSVQPANAAVTVAVGGGVFPVPPGDSQYSTRVSSSEATPITVQAVVPGGGLAVGELMTLPNFRESEPNDTQANPNELFNMARTGSVIGVGPVWDVDWYVVGLQQPDQRMRVSLHPGVNQACVAGMEVEVRRASTVVGTMVVSPQGTCPILELSHLDVGDYRIRVTMAGLPGGLSWDYTVSAQVFGPECGDGVQDEGEACDDGNRAAGDSCSPTCTVGAGYAFDVHETSTEDKPAPAAAEAVHFLPYSAQPARDEGFAVLELPFSFPFFARTFHGLLLTTNGYLSFLPTDESGSNLTDPAGPRAPNALVAAVGMDLRLLPASTVRWWIEDDASAQQQRMIIALEGLALAGDARPSVTARVELSSGGEVVIAYGDLAFDSGLSFFAGLEGPEGLVQVGLPRCMQLCEANDVQGRTYTFTPAVAVTPGG